MTDTNEPIFYIFNPDIGLHYDTHDESWCDNDSRTAEGDIKACLENLIKIHEGEERWEGAKVISLLG